MIGHYNRVNALKIPQYHELMWPALQATKELGGSATVSEMNERAMASAGITEQRQAAPHGEGGRMSEVEYRLHWARTHLKGIGALGWRDSFRERRLARRASHAAGAEGEEEAEAEGGWKDQLIARLLQLPPDGFERLAQRILREARFVNERFSS
jgi:restriction system protein